MAKYRSVVVILALALAVCSGPLAGESPRGAGQTEASEPGGISDGESATLFREFLEVNVVNIEVFVSDGKGSPVLDLTARDSQILEDGSKVKLTNFLAPGQPLAQTAIDSPASRQETEKTRESVGAEAGSEGDRGTERATLVVLIDGLISEPHIE